MITPQLFPRKFESVPAATSWYLADLGEAREKHELFTRQSPHRLKVLREHALIESAVSSNRIEGVEVDQSRIAIIVFGKSLLRDSDEEEVRGYRQALTLIHEPGTTAGRKSGTKGWTPKGSKRSEMLERSVSIMKIVRRQR
jgi:hypothetical protein